MRYSNDSPIMSPVKTMSPNVTLPSALTAPIGFAGIGLSSMTGSMRKLNIPCARGFVPELSVYSFFTAGFHFASLAANSLVNVAASTPSSDWTLAPSSSAICIMMLDTFNMP